MADGERLRDGGFLTPPKESENDQKMRAYVQRMRELTSSVAEHNRRIRELKGLEHDISSSHIDPA